MEAARYAFLICLLLLMYLAILDRAWSKPVSWWCAPVDFPVIDQNGNISCLPCPLCPDGYELNIHCGNLITENAVIGCKPCKHGMYKERRGSEVCKPCTPCAKNEIVQSECRKNNNTVCGKCGKGFYLDNSANGSCLPCSYCCPDSVDEEIKECSDAGLPFHMRCRFQSSKSCKTKCGLKQIAIVPLKTQPNVKDVRHSRCIKCPICPAGTGLDIPCGSTISLDEYLRQNITCVACISGKTYSEGANSDSCKPCKSCGIGCEVIKKCNTSNDTVCGNCKPDSKSSVSIINQKLVIFIVLVCLLTLLLLMIIMVPLFLRYKYKKRRSEKDKKLTKLEWPSTISSSIPCNTIFFEKSGVEILFPDSESYRKYHDKITVEVDWSSEPHSSLSPTDVILSPVIKLRPLGLKFNKAVSVTLSHSARINAANTNWSIKVQRAELEDGKICKWKAFKTQLGAEREEDKQDKDNAIENNQVKIKVNELTAFVVIGEPRNPNITVSKIMQCALFIKTRVLAGSEIILSVFLIDDCEASFEKILKMEKENGRELMGSLHGFNLRCTRQGHVNIDIRGVSSGWELLPQEPRKMPEAQKIPFSECLDSYHTIPNRKLKFAHRDLAKKNFHCTLELSDSYGKALAIMPVFSHCYEELLHPSHFHTWPVEQKATSDLYIPRKLKPDVSLPRALTLQEKLNLKPLHLPQALREKIVTRLEFDNKSWKILASKLGFSCERIRLLDMHYLDPKESPATQLLYLIDATMSEMKVSQFLQILNELGMEDICQIIKNWINQSDAVS